MGSIAFPNELHLPDCATCVLSGDFYVMPLSCYLTGIVQAIASSLLSASSTLHILFLQLSAPAASLQGSQPIPTVLWLFSFLITCAFPSWAIYVSSGSSLLAVFADSGLNSEFWLWWGFFPPSLDVIWSHPARGSLVLYLSFVLIIICLICLFFVLLSPALFDILACMTRDVTQEKQNSLWAEAA